MMEEAVLNNTAVDGSHNALHKQALGDVGVLQPQQQHEDLMDFTITMNDAEELVGEEKSTLPVLGQDMLFNAFQENGAPEQPESSPLNMLPLKKHFAPTDAGELGTSTTPYDDDDGEDSASPRSDSMPHSQSHASLHSLHECKSCGIQFGDLDSLQLHELSHDHDDIQTCIKCLSEVMSSHMTEHMASCAGQTDKLGNGVVSYIPEGTDLSEDCNIDMDTHLNGFEVNGGVSDLESGVLDQQSIGESERLEAHCTVENQDISGQSKTQLGSDALSLSSTEGNLTPDTLYANSIGTISMSYSLRPSNESSTCMTPGTSKQSSTGENDTEEDREIFCKVCKVKCADNSSFKSHLEVNHPDAKLYSCIFCECSYVSLLSLNEHLSAEHKFTICFGCGQEIPESDVPSHLKTCQFPMIPKFRGKVLGVFQSQNKSRKPVEMENNSRLKAKMFKCNVCGKSFKSLRKQKLHTAFFHASTPYQCFICFQRFGTKQSLLQHQRNKHEDNESRKPECDTCGKAFESRRSLTLHAALRHKQGKCHRCKKCRKTFRRHRQLQDHMQSHSIHHHPPHHHHQNHVGTARAKAQRSSRRKQQQQQQPLFDCILCSQTFSSMLNLEAHMSIAHVDVGLNSCTICDMAFSSQWNLEQHMVVHSDGGGSMPIAGHSQENFGGRVVEPTITSYPIVHQAIKSEPVDYSYGDLANNFRNMHPQSAELDLRISEAFSLVDPAMPPAPPQGMAAGSFGDAEMMQQRQAPNIAAHVPQHAGDPNTGYIHDCVVCGMEYHTKHALTSHMQTWHGMDGKTGLQMWDCDKCSKTFPTQQQLGRHKKAHASATKCSACGLKYKYGKAHQKVCTGKFKPVRKRRKGPVEGKQKQKTRRRFIKTAFVPQQLNVAQPEIKTSEGRKPRTYKVSPDLFKAAPRQRSQWKCSACPKSFSTRNRLRRHMRSHSDREQYCPSCGKQFTTTNGFDRHVPECQKLGTHECEECHAKFRSKNSAQEHRLEHLKAVIPYARRPTYECCKKIFPNIVVLHAHQNEQHGKSWQTIKCPLCKEPFDKLSSYILHVESNPSLEMFSCPSCPSSFHDLIALGKHLKQHPNDKKWCPACEAQFPAWDLPVHRKQQHGSELWTEDDAPASDPNVQSLSEATGRNTPGRPKHSLHQRKFECSICGENFSSYYYFQKHCQAEHSPKKETSTTDTEAQKDIPAMKNLSVVLKPIRSVQCGYCLETFKSEYFLKKHSSSCSSLGASNVDLEKDSSEQNTANGQHSMEPVVTPPVKRSKKKGSKENIKVSTKKTVNQKDDEAMQEDAAAAEDIDSPTVVLSQPPVVSERRVKTEAAETPPPPSPPPLLEEASFEEPVMKEVMGGYKPMTVDGPNQSYCETCRVYFASPYYLTKHEVVHERGIDIGFALDDVAERRKNLERTVWELTHKPHPRRQRSTKCRATKTRTKFRCPTCQQYFRSYYFLNVHIKETQRTCQPPVTLA